MNEHLIDRAVTIGSTLFVAGVAWGVMRATVKGLGEKLDLHITNSNEWRTQMGTQIQNITSHLFGSK